MVMTKSKEIYHEVLIYNAVQSAAFQIREGSWVSEPIVTATSWLHETISFHFRLTSIEKIV